MAVSNVNIKRKIRDFTHLVIEVFYALKTVDESRFFFSYDEVGVYLCDIAVFMKLPHIREKLCCF